MKGRIVYGKDGPVFYLNGQVCTKEVFDQAFPPVATAAGAAPGLVGWKPIKSDALAVHPLDVAEATADAKAKGVPTEFLADGRPVLSSRSHRKQYLKAYGFHDRKGGYGD